MPMEKALQQGSLAALTVGAFILVLACSVGASEPSALDVAERQAEWEALAASLDEYWLSEREMATGEQLDGFLVPQACEQRLARAQQDDDILVNALVLAAVAEPPATDDIYDLWGRRVALLEGLDSALKGGCTGG